ncbi:chaplin-A-like [Schistocerca gregaria]|uniref:chaplin-A-like n=1 Tax=Schistocerca gregaria TaxID=7010 RepID=UPI00211E4B06|nr:chaplin-A-like [Schistocerca gregaria]
MVPLVAGYKSLDVLELPWSAEVTDGTAIGRSKLSTASCTGDVLESNVVVVPRGNVVTVTAANEGVVQAELQQNEEMKRGNGNCFGHEAKPYKKCAEALELRGEGYPMEQKTLEGPQEVHLEEQSAGPVEEQVPSPIAQDPQEVQAEKVVAGPVEEQVPPPTAQDPQEVQAEEVVAGPVEEQVPPPTAQDPQEVQAEEVVAGPVEEQVPPPTAQDPQEVQAEEVVAGPVEEQVPPPTAQEPQEVQAEEVVAGLIMNDDDDDEEEEEEEEEENMKCKLQ